DNAADYPDQSIHAAIEAQAANTPDAIAISAADGAYTYGQLIRRAKAISDALRSRGVQHGDRVGIMLPRGRDIVASMLGVLGSGACYVPLDPSYPDERLRHMVSDSGAAAVITTRDLEGRFD